MEEKLISKTPIDMMTDQEKFELKLVAQCLAEEWIDKITLGGVINASERIVRDRISRVAKDYPIIFSSGKKGYKMALNEKDLPLVKQTIKELESRIFQLRKRIKPLKKFVKEQEKENER